MFNAAQANRHLHWNGLHTQLIFFFLSTDYLAEQSPAPPFALNFEDISNDQVTGTVLLPEEHQHSHHSLSPLLHSSSTAINAEFQSTVSSSEALDRSIKESGDAEKPLVLSRTSPLSLMDLFERTLTLQLSQGTRSSRPPEMLLEQTLVPMQPFKEPKEDPAASRHPAPAAKVIMEELFSNLPSNRPVRRTKIEPGVQVAGQAQSPVPAVCTDATDGDCLWSKLRPSSQRDSMSSSSSISSTDTVIDLSLHNPVVKNVNCFSTVSNSCDPTWVTCCRSPLTSLQSECPKDKLTPCSVLPPLAISVESPSKHVQRRHTWSRLYMDELKQSSVSRLPFAATSESMSKSLGDLTSEDISCRFDSTYHSISRSFVSRSTREKNPKERQKPQPADNLTEQLRKLASVEPLTAKDFAVECRAREMEEATGVRRTSRSHSRVRYIASRAKKAQERQRIQGRSASFSFATCAGSSSGTSPIEERGNPEGACSSAQGTCTSGDLLEQLNLLASQSPRLSHLPAEPDNTEVFFLLRL